MKITKSKKIMTVLLAVLMVFCAIPMNWGMQKAVAADSASSKPEWKFSVYGIGSSVNKASYTGSAETDKIIINCNTGKLVPASTDGVAFYYTTVPTGTNFTLRAKVTSNAWTLSNGQEGFGLLAVDRVPTSGTGGPYWNNSYMAGAMRVAYYYDKSKMDVSTGNTGKSITMRLGIGAQEKAGVTPDNLSKLAVYDTQTVQNEFLTSTYPLETSAGEAYAKGETMYDNIVANGTVPTLNGNAVLEGTNPNAVTDMYLTIQKNNTGYFISYEDMSGKVVTKKFYGADALEKLDKDNVYVGFFTSGTVKATFSDITFTTIAPENDAPAEERPIEKVPVKLSFRSASQTGIKDYQFMFTVNCDGKATITNVSTGGVVAENIDVKADKLVKTDSVRLPYGQTNFKISFTPDANYKPGEYKQMESYKTISTTKTIECELYGEEGGSLWVAPNANGKGTKDDPMDIYTAVKFVGRGQTIILKEGTYLLNSAITVARGINGTADKKISMIADPDAKTRPILDFQEKGSGISLVGDYWVLKGFDITRGTSAGLRVHGNYNLIEQVNSYYNKNTGINISTQSSTDTRDMWPTYNTVLNCTSYGNADEGYADGFGAKLTCGAGNVFDGCIAHHNADDGWDLFAKVELGNIESVTIKNSVAYANGYLEDGTKAGNGNGFKLGGENLSGKHVLENCVAYDNKAKGIDANSCPDVIVRDCISFNNGAQNVAFYTTASVSPNTDFSASGIISYRTKNTSIGEHIAPLGTQDNSKIYNVSNYYWNKSLKKSVNTANQEVSANWFKSLDTTAVPTRNADGTINMNGLLELTDTAIKAISADYTAVNAAIAKANALNASDYKDFSAVTQALANVVTGLRNSRQSEVDAMAEAITAAINSLVKAEAPTEKPSESETATQAPTEKPSESESATQAPTEKPSESEPATQAPTEKPSESEPTTQAPTEKPSESEPATQAPTEKPTEIESATQPSESETDNTGVGGDNVAPGTGDNSLTAIYSIFVVMSITALASLVLFKRGRLVNRYSKKDLIFMTFREILIFSVLRKDFCVV